MNQASARFLLPSPVARVMGRLPAFPGSLLFAAGLNLVVKESIPEDVRRQLEGRKLRIRVTDAGVAFDFEWRNGRFCPCQRLEAPDLTISACAWDFVLLAQRKEDPDTLFFSRRLVTEGDTELGLLVKNTLDAIDMPVFELGRLAPVRVFERLRAGLR